MSYILDALKKADAERERGAVPGLHSQPQGQIGEDDEAASPRTVSPAMWLAAGAGICLILVLGWQLASRPSVPATEPASPAVAEASPPLSPTLPSAQAPTPTSGSALPVQAAPEPPAPSIPPLATRPAQPVASRTATNTAAPPSAAPPSAATTKPAAQPAPTATRIPTASELPEDIRRDLPPLTIGGAMYSDTPSSRMLIINSQVFHEGDQPYQGLVLEEIRLKSAVFNYRGHRYAVNY